MVASVRMRLVRSADVLDEANDGAKSSCGADELQNVQRLTEVYKRCPAIPAYRSIWIRSGVDEMKVPINRCRHTGDWREHRLPDAR
jgi:hypothetical protein